MIMKKLLTVALFLLAFSCGKKSVLAGNRCTKAADEYLNAIKAWSTDTENKTKCEAVKKQLNAIIKDCSIYTAAQRKIYEDQLKDFTCD